MPPIRYIDGAAWVDTWRRAGPALEAIRIAELRQTDVAQFIRATDSAFNAMLARSELRATSGLVDQQRVLHGRAG